MNRTLTILTIDDDSNMRYLTSRTLKTHISDYDLVIHEADNGALGLHHLTTSSSLPDLILLDINMPVMDGLAFLREYENVSLSSNPSPIFILSSMVTYWKQEPVMIPKFVKGLFEKPLNKGHISEIILYLISEYSS